MSALDTILPRPSWPKELRTHISASQVGMFSRCPEQFRRRYVLGEKERPGAAMLWGGVDGATFEHNFRQKIDSHEDLPLPDLELVFAETLDQRVDGNGGAGEIEWGKEYAGVAPAQAFADVKDRGVKLVGAYHRQIAPSVQPIAVERKFTYDIGLEVPVLGYLDIETEEDVKEAKTSARSVSAVKNDWRLQGHLYQAATHKPVEWHVKVKSKTPAVLSGATVPGLALPYSPEAVEATEERVRGLVRLMLNLLATVGPDDPWPTNAPDSWGNVCGYCGFRSTCAWWKGQ